MKTLLLTLEFPPFKGGVANYYGHLANYWPLGENLLILDNSRGELVSGRGFFAWWPGFSTLKEKLRLSRIDYVLVGQILPLGTITWILSLFRPLKYAVILHGLDFSAALRVPRKRFLARLILKRADKIICANSYTADKVKEFYSGAAEKISVVNPGVPAGVPQAADGELAELRNKHGLNDKIVLFSLGRLVRRKGFDQVIQALTALAAEGFDNLAYCLAGRGVDEAYLRSLVPAEMIDKIIFLGELTEKEKWQWLELSDIFAMPARDLDGDFEGFGIVYLEANLCGKPVIAGRAGGVADAVVDDQTGIIVDPEDLNDLKAGIRRLAADPELRKTLGEQGRSRALNEFNWEKQVAKLVKGIKG
ncbi:MAG: glycosyltransferase family 4 protein [Patescibacteria group bacterium]|jgi:phosphatidylinositol alpha-1,6-mannosyltransferase